MTFILAPIPEASKENEVLVHSVVLKICGTQYPTEFCPDHCWRKIQTTITNLLLTVEELLVGLPSIDRSEMPQDAEECVKSSRQYRNLRPSFTVPKVCDPLIHPSSCSLRDYHRLNHITGTALDAPLFTPALPSYPLLATLSELLRLSREFRYKDRDSGTIPRPISILKGETRMHLVTIVDQLLLRSPGSTNARSFKVSVSS